VSQLRENLQLSLRQRVMGPKLLEEKKHANLMGKMHIIELAYEADFAIVKA
jgi:acyl CoA:acetate/3-ketoacid CoA transferase alpha subunit